MRCMSENWIKQMEVDSMKVSVINEDWKKKYEIFDETKFPLATGVDTKHFPDVDKLEKHIKAIFKIGQLAHESLVMAVAYLDRIRNNSDFFLMPQNWRRMSLCCLILASKVWEDQAVWNVDFLDLFPLTTPHDLGQLEKKLLSLLSFDVSLKASEYAAIYFDLKAQTSAEHFLELNPLDRDGEEKLELRSKNYTLKHDIPEARLFRSTGSVDDFTSTMKSPRTVLS